MATMASEHTPPLHDSLLLEHGGGAARESSYEAPFGMLSASPSGLSDPFHSVPLFSSLDLDTMPPAPFGAQAPPMLWQDLRPPPHDGAWAPPTSPPPRSAPPEAPTQQLASDVLPSSVADLRLDTPSSQRARLTGDSVSSQETVGEAERASATPENRVPQTPMRTATRAPPAEARAAPSTPVSLPDDETPVKGHGEAPADDTFRGTLLYELSATPPAMLAQGIPPMTPLADARRASLDEPRSGLMRAHRSGPSISSSSAISASTPEYGSAHSIASSADLRSPGFPYDSAHLDLSPHKAATLPFGAEMYGGVPGQVPYFPHVPMTPQSATPLHRATLQGALSLDEPFGTPEQFMSPHAHAPPLTMSPGLLLYDQHHDAKMGRVASAPSLPHGGLPSWPSEHELGLYTPGHEPISFPASPSSCTSNLPVNSTAMARKCYTPYAKTAPSPLMYGSPLEMDPFLAHGGMPTSKSMNAISSGPMSPLPPGPGRRRSQMTESISMPGDQMPSLLDFEAAPPGMRGRGRNTGPPPLVVSSADKLHVCHCGRRFKRMEHLKRHNRTHTQERPHKCPVESCGKSFGRSDNLAQHLKTHYRPAGLVGRASEVLHTEPAEPARPRDRRHDPHAAAAAAASAAAASAAFAAPTEPKREADAPSA